MNRWLGRARRYGLVAPLWLCACRILEPSAVLEPFDATAIPPTTARVLASIDDARLRDAGLHAQDWITHGRTYSEQRFSPLTELRTDNVDPREYLERLDEWKERIEAEGGTWRVINDLDRLETLL